MNRHRDIDILAVGSLIRLKQYDLLIEIIAEMVNSFPAIQCVICGDGPEKNRLLEMIRERNLQKNIIIADACPHSEVLERMSRTRLFLHTSSYEGFSTVCLEALYSGARVISFIDPLMGPISNWYIVNNKEAMSDLAIRLLKDSPSDYSRVFPYPIQESAKQLMNLFSYKEQLIS